jgi:SAM-dependent methyltransferase
MCPRKMNVAEYDKTAREINAPLYRYYAQKILEKTGITRGVCLDAGCGGGYLGLALAKMTRFSFIFLDKSSEMLERAALHIIEDKLGRRAGTLLADVHSIPLDDQSVDLVISRGSMPFWEDPGTAFKQIHRILAPGGRAYMGGGRGSSEIREEIAARMKQAGKEMPGMKCCGDGSSRGPHGRRAHRDYGGFLETAGITNYAVNRGDDGVWVEMWR